MKPRSAVVAGAIAAVAVGLLSTPQETQVRVEETQVQETHMDDYKAVWDWCGVRFPFRQDLQEACRWGAYELIPGQTAPTDEGTQDA